ncbi:MAG TPA: amidohydrolase family protein [Acetobacteraceae bacterium]|jgi:predicted TIM-barrel fold metal-dependent hydrolase
MFCCPGCLRSRRTFLAADAPAGAPVDAPASAPVDAPGGAPSATRWIDVHCHVFNSLDLPVNEFIDQTRLSGPLALPEAMLIAIAAGFIQNASPTAQAEAAQLNGEAAAWEPPPSRDTQAALRALAQPPAAAADTHAFPPPPSRGNDLLRDAANSVNGTAAPPGTPVSDDEIAQLAERIENDDTLLRMLNWAGSFSRARNDIVTSLLRQFSGGAKPMLTPALIDYNRWLAIAADSDAERLMSPLADQLGVMAAVSRVRALAGVPVFAFAPFDPWRYLEDQHAGRDDILKIAQPFIDAGSIIGFKVYPPMGFAAAGNASRPAASFPTALQHLTNERPGAALDQAMSDLFQFCVGRDVPILAHCANSNYREADGSALWASPVHWQAALSLFPSLRLNFGHFGGVWDFAASHRASATDQDGAAEILAQGWARIIIGMMPDHPNIYADVAFANTLLPTDNDPELQATWAFLHDMLGGNPVLGDRLMYGSDWEMVGEAAGGDDYASALMRNVQTLFSDPAVEKFRWRNAARFLGLGENDKTRGRLEGFRGSIGADANLLVPFDPDAPSA